MTQTEGRYIAQYLEQKVIDEHVLWGDRYITILQCKVIDQHGKTWYVKTRYITTLEQPNDGYRIENLTPNFVYDWQEV